MQPLVHQIVELVASSSVRGLLQHVVADRLISVMESDLQIVLNVNVLTTPLHLLWLHFHLRHALSLALQLSFQ